MLAHRRPRRHCVSNTRSVQNSAPNNADRPWLCDNLASFVGDISLLSKSCALRRVLVVLKSCRIRLSAPQSTNVLRSVCSRTNNACSISLFMGMRGCRAIVSGFFLRPVLRVFWQRGGWRSCSNVERVVNVGGRGGRGGGLIPLPLVEVLPGTARWLLAPDSGRVDSAQLCRAPRLPRCVARNQWAVRPALQCQKCGVRHREQRAPDAGH